MGPSSGGETLMGLGRTAGPSRDLKVVDLRRMAVGLGHMRGSVSTPWTEGANPGTRPHVS